MSPSNPGAVWAKVTFDTLMGKDNLETQQQFDPVEQLKKGKEAPNGLVSIGTADEFKLQPELLTLAIAEGKHANIQYDFIADKDHFNIVPSQLELHLDFHAKHLLHK